MSCPTRPRVWNYRASTGVWRYWAEPIYEAELGTGNVMTNDTKAVDIVSETNTIAIRGYPSGRLLSRGRGSLANADVFGNFFRWRVIFCRLREGGQMLANFCGGPFWKASQQQSIQQAHSSIIDLSHIIVFSISSLMRCSRRFNQN